MRIQLTDLVKTAGLAAALALTSTTVQAQAKPRAEPAQNVKTIQARGKLLCPGHNGSYRGFAEVDSKGQWKGLDIELCRALATMLLGAPDKAEIIPISWVQRYPALQSGDLDVVIKLSEWTMSRDTELNLQFSMPYIFGGTQFATRKDLGIKSAKELEGATICGEAGTSTVRHAANYLTGLKLKYNLVQYEKQEEAQAAYNAGRCDAFIGWGPNLAVFLTDAKGGQEQNAILPELVNMGPQSIAMRQGDDRFVDTVNWMLSILLLAEFEGVTAANVDQMKAKPPSPSVAKMLGVDPGLGDRLGLPNDWGYKVIKAVGNYGEIFERNVGKHSPYKLARGVNQLWRDGGIMYPYTLD